MSDRMCQVRAAILNDDPQQAHCPLYNLASHLSLAHVRPIPDPRHSVAFPPVRRAVSANQGACDGCVSQNNERSACADDPPVNPKLTAFAGAYANV